MSIPIIDETHINPIFIRANAWLIDQYEDFFLDNDNKNFQTLETLWNKEFDASLTYDQNLGIYTHIKFASNEKMMLFLIRWA